MQFDNMVALIVSFLGVKIPIHAPKNGVCGKARENDRVGWARVRFHYSLSSGKVVFEDGLGVLGLADSPHVVVTLGYPSGLAGDGVPSWWV